MSNAEVSPSSNASTGPMRTIGIWATGFGVLGWPLALGVLIAGSKLEAEHGPHASSEAMSDIAAALFLLAPLALLGTITELAAATVLLLLLVFVVVNGALFILQGRKGEHRGRFEIPRALPALGALVCSVLIVVRIATGDVTAPALAGGLLLGALAIYVVTQRRT